MPPGSPIAVANRAPKTASSMVAGRDWPISLKTGCPKAMDRPRSPSRMWPSQIAYWCMTGRCRPISRRNASISSFVAFGGMDMATGSAGISRSTMKTRIETSSISGIATAIRRNTMPRISPLIGQT